MEIPDRDIKAKRGGFVKLINLPRSDGGAGAGLFCCLFTGKFFDNADEVPSTAKAVVDNPQNKQIFVHCFILLVVDKAAGCQAAAGRMPACRGFCCGWCRTGSGGIVAGGWGAVKGGCVAVVYPHAGVWRLWWGWGMMVA